MKAARGERAARLRPALVAALGRVASRLPLKTAAERILPIFFSLMRMPHPERILSEAKPAEVATSRRRLSEALVAAETDSETDALLASRLVGLLAVEDDIALEEYRHIDTQIKNITRKVSRKSRLEPNLQQLLSRQQQSKAAATP